MDYLKRYDIFGWQCPLHNGQSVLLGEKYTEHSRSQTESWLKAAWDRYSKDLSGSLEKTERKWGISMPSEIFILTDRWVSLLVYIFQSNTFRQSSKSVVKKGTKRKGDTHKIHWQPLQKTPPNPKPSNCSWPPGYLVEIRTELYSICWAASRYVLQSACLSKSYQFFHSAPGDLLVEHQNGFAKLC